MPAKPAKAASTIARGTVMEIVPSAGESMPNRLILQQKNGTLLVAVSRVAIEAEVGDDVVLEGVRLPADAPGVPAELFVDSPNLAHNRFRAISRAGAELRAFGAAATGPRPGMIAWMRATGRRIGRMQPIHGGARIAAARDSMNQAFGWALEMFRGLDVPWQVFVLDPVVAQPLALDAGKPVSEQLAKRIHGLMRRSLSENTLWFDRTGESSKFIADSSGVAYLQDQTRGQAVSYNWASVSLPYVPSETSLYDWQYLTKLSSRDFYPKQRWLGSERWQHTVIHELAHTVQDRYGITGRAKHERPNLHECFADAFAVLAYVKKGGNEAYLDCVAKMRASELVMYDLVHYTSPAIAAALAKGREWRDAGTLATMSTDALLKAAAVIARDTSMTRAEIRAIVDARNDHYRAAGIHIEPSGQISPRDARRVWETAEAAIAQGGAALGVAAPHVARGLKDVADVTFTPSELDDPKTAAAIREIYRADLAETIGLANGNRAIVESIVARERIGQELAYGAGNVLFTSTDPAAPDRAKILAEIAAAPFARFQTGLLDAAAVAAAALPEAAPIRYDETPPLFSFGGARRHPGLVEGFALGFDHRLSRYVELRRNEIAALEAATDGSAGALRRANEIADRARQSGWTLRVDGDAWARVKKIGNPALEAVLDDIGHARKQPRIGRQNVARLLAARRAESAAFQSLPTVSRHKPRTP